MMNHSSPQLNCMNLTVLGLLVPTQSLGSTLIRVGAKLENPKEIGCFTVGQLGPNFNPNFNPNFVLNLHEVGGEVGQLYCETPAVPKVKLDRTCI